jgi:hypothetical protein
MREEGGKVKWGLPASFFASPLGKQKSMRIQAGFSGDTASVGIIRAFKG